MTLSAVVADQPAPAATGGYRVLHVERTESVAALVQREGSKGCSPPTANEPRVSRRLRRHVNPIGAELQDLPRRASLDFVHSSIVSADEGQPGGFA